MYMRIGLCLIFYFLQFKLQSQPLRSDLLQRLYQTDQPIPSVNTPFLTGLFPERTDKRYAYNKQYLVKTDRQLLLGVAGTGLLYEIYPISTGVFDAKRIDSTLYAGNNFCAANFSFDSVVYSYGGYGFWKTNGSLKQYNPYSREWDIIPLFEERSSTFCQGPSGINWKKSFKSVPDLKDFNSTFAPSFFWIDSSAKLFYMAAQHVVNEDLADTLQTNNSKFNNLVSVLDIDQRKWVTLGSLFRYGWHYNIQLPWGLLIIESPESIYVADFKRNKLLFCKKELWPRYRKFFKDNGPDLIYYANGFIYLGSPTVNSFDSIPFQLSDFDFTGEPLYSEINSVDLSSKWGSLDYLIIVVILFLLALIVALWIKRRARGGQKTSSIPQPSSALSLRERFEILDETEVSLILLLVNHSLRGKKTTIEEVNKLAGVAQKSEPIRRRVRSELINSINEKWIIVTGSRERLVTSVKSSFDARTREYYIVEKWLASDFITQLSENSLPAQ